MGARLGATQPTERNKGTHNTSRSGPQGTWAGYALFTETRLHKFDELLFCPEKGRNRVKRRYTSPSLTLRGQSGTGPPEAKPSSQSLLSTSGKARPLSALGDEGGLTRLCGGRSRTLHPYKGESRRLAFPQKLQSLERLSSQPEGRASVQRRKKE